MADVRLREAEQEFLRYPSYDAAQSLWLLRQRAGLSIWNMPVLPRPEPDGADHHRALELVSLAWADGPVVPHHLNRYPSPGPMGRPRFGRPFGHDFLNHISAIEVNLVRKMKSKRRTYSYELAEKAWIGVIDEAAKAYNLLHRGQITLRGIDKATRLAAARMLATDFERRVNANDLSVDLD